FPAGSAGQAAPRGPARTLRRWAAAPPAGRSTAARRGTRTRRARARRLPAPRRAMAPPAAAVVAGTSGPHRHPTAAPARVRGRGRSPPSSSGGCGTLYAGSAETLASMAHEPFWARRKAQLTSGLRFSRRAVRTQGLDGIAHDFDETRAENGKV